MIAGGLARVPVWVLHVHCCNHARREIIIFYDNNRVLNKVDYIKLPGTYLPGTT